MSTAISSLGKNQKNGYLWVSIFWVVGSMALLLLGLVILSSASHSFKNGIGGFFIKQLIWAVLSIGVGCVMAFISLDLLKKYTSILTLALWGLLALVLVPGLGLEINGSRRWLSLGFSNIQPSEFMKFGIVILLARYLSSNQRELSSFWKGFIMPCILFGLPTGMIFLQPDFGTSFLCGLVGVSLLYLAGGRLLFMIPSFLVALIGFIVAVILDPVRLRRVTSFMNIEENKLDSAFQLWQGMLAFGVGSVHGVGLGNGRQQMDYLPEAHTDFIFSIVGEELGMVFTIGVWAIFFGFFVFGIFSLKKCQDSFHFLLGAGAMLFVVFQGLINMGVVTGCLPTKGMSLPFISYGGSNLLVMCAFVGLIVNVIRREHHAFSREPTIVAKRTYRL